MSSQTTKKGDYNVRKLFLLRGAPGVGKSSFIEKLNLHNYTLSLDNFRLYLQSPILTETGELKINQTFGSRDALHMLFHVVENRMKNGDSIIIDATHSKVSDINSYKMLADKYRYDIIIIDFSSVPLEIALERNAKRTPSYKIVPNVYIEKVYRRLKTEKIPDSIQVIPFEKAEEVFFPKPIDLSYVRKIHHIGDIHGCFSVLKRYLKHGLHHNELYIFTGDYIDRGIENAEVIEFLLSIMDYPNVILLEGNHEKHLWKWANGERANSIVFEHDTKKELEQYGINRKEVRRFCRKLKPYFHYTYYEKEVLVTHGGLPVIPENIQFISAEQLIHGVGDAKFPIDEVFDKNLKHSNQYQVHGHRNFGLKPYQPGSHSFNLEGGIDSGGFLRVVTLTPDGFRSNQIQNEVYQEKRKKIG